MTNRWFIEPRPFRQTALLDSGDSLFFFASVFSAQGELVGWSLRLDAIGLWRAGYYFGPRPQAAVAANSATLL